MELSSARELKAKLHESVLRPLKAAQGRAFGIAAQSLARGASAHRSIALGISARTGSGFQLAVRVQREELHGGEQVEAIRKATKGEVDVVFVGQLSKRAPNRIRPLQIGCSIGHVFVTAGTLGGFAKSRDGTGGKLVLSNNHVLANENNAKAGDLVLQPGIADAGQNPADVVGNLVRFVPLATTGPNLVDCAVASVNDGIAIDEHGLPGIGTLRGLGVPRDKGVQVSKVGRTTDVTRGVVTAFELDNVVVGYDIGNVSFDDQVEIEGAGTLPFSGGGDSGSLIVNGAFEAVALLFAGGEQGGSNGRGLTYGNPIRAVLDALQIDLR
jgi:hypothetical protein